MHPNIRVGDFLRLSAQRVPDVACFLFPDGREQSFAETNTRVNRLADAMRRRGVAKGDGGSGLVTDLTFSLKCMRMFL